MGKVSAHDNSISNKTLMLAFFVIRPIPKREPTDTCVVDTGIPSRRESMRIRIGHCR